MRAQESQLALLGTPLSHADKILWPASKAGPSISKADLARYYLGAWEWMAPHIHGRPCSIVRAPDGLNGEHFFQRHPMQGAALHIGRVKVRGATRPYLEFDTAKSLVAAAQIAALELHPWNCRAGDPETPGRLVFDLDPAPNIDFAEVALAARDLHARLLDLGLQSFCKTTGGKGLHVVAPLRIARSNDCTWGMAKAFALHVCELMVGDFPQRFVVALPKHRRRGKIFLDYLRNDRTATAVAPLSPRARYGAPVSMPLTWAQVRADLDPGRFTLHTALKLLDQSKAWSEYGASSRSLPPIARKFLGKHTH